MSEIKVLIFDRDNAKKIHEEFTTIEDCRKGISFFEEKK